MMKLGWGVAAALMLWAIAVLPAHAETAQGPRAVGATAPTQVAQMPPGGPGGAGGFQPMSQEERAKIREQMMERVLDQAQLTDSERIAAKQALQAKDAAQQTLNHEFTKLLSAINRPDATEQTLSDALAAYRGAVTQYRQKVEADDLALSKQLSVASEVRCMLTGVLDNGRSAMGMMAGGPRRRMGPGSAGPPGGMAPGPAGGGPGPGAE